LDVRCLRWAFRVSGGQHAELLPVLPRPDLAANLPSGRAEGMMEPTAERRQHHRISRDAVQLADSAGLARLERHGDITRRERAAGEEFARLFHLANLDPLKASDMGGERIIATRAGQHSSERARRRVTDALDALGIASGSCAWHVIGCESTMAEWARRQNWSSRPIRPEVAKGILIATLGSLARHFGV
jgi:hypothetical protein